MTKPISNCCDCEKPLAVGAPRIDVSYDVEAFDGSGRPLGRITLKRLRCKACADAPPTKANIEETKARGLDFGSCPAHLEVRASEGPSQGQVAEILRSFDIEIPNMVNGPTETAFFKKVATKLLELRALADGMDTLKSEIAKLKPPEQVNGIKVDPTNGVVNS